jgi:hypothetical protein
VSEDVKQRKEERLKRSLLITVAKRSTITLGNSGI